MGLSHKYIRCSAEEKDGYRYRVLQRNKIIGVIRPDKRTIDNNCFYYFDITSMQSIKYIFEKQSITLEQIEQIMDNLEQVLDRLESFLLISNELCLRPEYIMEDYNTGKIHFIYYPDDKKEQSEDLDALTEFFLERLSGEDEDIVNQIYEFYNEQLLRGEEITAKEYVAIWKKYSWKKEERREVELQEYKEKEKMDIKKYIPQFWEKKIYKVPYQTKNPH